MLIEDPGSGNRARVSEDGLLEVARLREIAFFARQHGKAFIGTSEAITTDGTANDVFHLLNDSDDVYVCIDDLEVSCDTAMTIIIQSGETVSAGGTEATPRNLNRSSNLGSVVTVNYGDDITMAGTAVVLENVYQGVGVPLERDFKGALILGPGDTLGVNLNAAAGTAFASAKWMELTRDQLSR